MSGEKPIYVLFLSVIGERVMEIAGLAVAIASTIALMYYLSKISKVPTKGNESIGKSKI